MHVARPYSAVCSTLEGEVLVVLARTERPLTGRGVARLVRVGSQAGVNRALRRLREHGLAHIQEAGAAVLYTLNRDHVAASIVEQLAGLHDELLRRLRGSIAAWTIAPVHASLFGSAARGDGDTSSDIDVFLVRPGRVGEGAPDWRAQVDQWVASIRAWTGNQVGLAEVSERELAQLRRRRPAILASLRADGIKLAGAEVSKLLKRVP